MSATGCLDYFNKSEGVLNISVTNMKDFEELIFKAKKQADELQNTIDQLEKFKLEIKFSDGKNEC